MAEMERFLREWVTPVARAAGFRQTGRSYRVASALGDESIVSFSTNTLKLGEAGCLFGVHMAVVPRSFWFVMSGERADSHVELRAIDGIWRRSLRPPTSAVAAQRRSQAAHVWRFFDDSSRAQAGSALVDQLGGGSLSSSR